MSNARPMTSGRRDMLYGQRPRTARQWRQLVRMAKRESLRVTGDLEHGASGVPVRKPHFAGSGPLDPLARLHCSLTTHIAYYCDPCRVHAAQDRPRLHRRPRVEVSA